MKKTLTVNLGGTVFHIDEDAYHLLDKYLANLKMHFRKEVGADEIVKDMELRISELLTEKVNAGFQVISIDYVEEVIKRMGKPEELSGEDIKDEEKTSNETRQEPYSSKESDQAHRRFYRNPDDKILGGVASGLAAYMGWDPNFWLDCSSLFLHSLALDLLYLSILFAGLLFLKHIQLPKSCLCAEKRYG